MLESLKQMRGRALRARDGEIGSVKDFYFDDHFWHIRYLVVSTGRWLDQRDVLIGPEALEAADHVDQVFPVALTKEQVRHSPGVETDKPVSRQHEAVLRQYYGWPPYWGAVFDAGGLATPIATPVPTSQAAAGYDDGNTAPRRRGDPHLRSTKEVEGYGIEASDGGIGHVEDYIADTETWRIRYLIIDTRNWWPGKQVLVSPEWIDRVSWTERRVFVDLTRAAVKESPPYEGSVNWNLEYTALLHDYYGRPRYADWDRIMAAGGKQSPPR